MPAELDGDELLVRTLRPCLWFDVAFAQSSSTLTRENDSLKIDRQNKWRCVPVIKPAGTLLEVELNPVMHADTSPLFESPRNTCSNLASGWHRGFARTDRKSPRLNSSH